MSASAELDLFEVGTVISGKYRIERVIGRGGMGIVYAARHELLGRTVALKVVLPEIAANREVVARFMNEARSAARIESEHVAQVMDVDQLPNGTPYMVMELLEGEDLEARLQRTGPLGVQEIADVLLEALDGVAHAHALGIVHRDLKPANLFLATRQGRRPRVKVLDFGIAKALRGTPFGAAGVTSTKSILGSPAFMAPEQLRSSKSVDARADIWSFGVIAYQLATGCLPYDAEDVGGLFAAILEQEPRSPREHRPDLPEPFEQIVLRCLAKKPELRFQTVAELAALLAPMGTKTAERALERIEALDFTNPAMPIPFVPQHAAPLPAPVTATLAYRSDSNQAKDRAKTLESSQTTSPRLESASAALPPDGAKTGGAWATSSAHGRRARWPVLAVAGALLGVIGIAVIAMLPAQAMRSTSRALVSSAATPAEKISASPPLPSSPSVGDSPSASDAAPSALASSAVAPSASTPTTAKPRASHSAPKQPAAPSSNDIFDRH
jgi:serine/threonine protein kinase